MSQSSCVWSEDSAPFFLAASASVSLLLSFLIGAGQPVNVVSALWTLTVGVIP